MLQRRCYLVNRLTTHVFFVVARARIRSALDATLRVQYTGVGLAGAFRPFATALRATGYFGRHLAGTRGYRGTKTRCPRTTVHEVARCAHSVREIPPSRVPALAAVAATMLASPSGTVDARRSRAIHANGRYNLHFTILNHEDPSCRRIDSRAR